MLRAMARIAFPAGFKWGVATSAYQIEGSPLADGAVPSNWHRFAHRRGRIADGTTGDVACDHYNRYRTDIRLMTDLGVHAYRFSIAWSRIIPEPGKLNRKGLDFYERLVDDLLAAGIRGRLDFVGVNYYQRTRYGHSAFTPFTRAKEHREPSAPRSAMWEIYPQGLYRFLLRLRDEYGNPPCMITENGYPVPEVPGRDPLDDPERSAYLADHIAMVGKAIEQGVDCRGYFHWTLMDNFEWAYGNTMRFGFLRTNFATQERQWRKSACLYRDLIRNNALEIESVPDMEAG
jgi:beta-glucosidase/6-phospho-beta-glucosidase/beta-galactosidase